MHSAKLSVSPLGWFVHCTFTPVIDPPGREFCQHQSTYVPVDFGDHLSPELNRRGLWIGAHLDTWLSWPKELTKIIFEGTELYLLPETADLRPAVVCLSSGQQSDSIRGLIERFLSALTWMDHARARVEIWLSGSRPVRAGKGRGHATTTHFKYDFLPQNLPEDARLSLAFFREGLSLEHPAYQFLSFYKIINLRFPSGKAAQKSWMKNNLSKVEGEAATKRLAELGALQGQSIDDYLYQSCRCAVAHAGVDPTVDPESQEDERRLRSDLPLIRSLAELLIRTEYGIQTKSDVWDAHLYELEGFRAYLNDSTRADLDAGNYVPRRKVRFAETADVRTWGNRQLLGLKSLKLRVLVVEKGRALVRLRSDDFLTEIRVGLNFPDNRLEFDPLSDFALEDDGSAKAANSMADLLTFQKEMLLNGCIEIWDTQAGIYLGRGNAYIPLNFYVNPEGCDARIEEFRSLAKQRSDKAAGTTQQV